MNSTKKSNINGLTLKVVEAANILRRRIRIQELVDDGAWKPGIK